MMLQHYWARLNFYKMAVSSSLLPGGIKVQYLRLIFFMTLFCGYFQSANGASLFGGPKTIPDDGTWTASSSEKFSNPGGSCDVSCNSTKGYIQVDVQAQCMCITGGSCFKVDTGKPGTFTTNGLGRMGKATGNTYSTKAGPGDSTKFDYDAVSMGIASNAAYGKWIHKARDCQGGGKSTIGCIGVPCAKWPAVKKLALEGKSVQICNGVNYPTSIDRKYPSCRGGVPCYAAVSRSADAAGRAGLNVERSSSPDQDRNHAR
jgi:hypothetical protein